MSLLHPEWQTTFQSIKTTLPWQATRFGEYAEIEAYVTNQCSWETIADIRSLETICAEDIAQTIVDIINGYEKQHQLLQEAVILLEMCFVHEKLSDKVRERIKSMINILDAIRK